MRNSTSPNPAESKDKFITATQLCQAVGCQYHHLRLAVQRNVITAPREVVGRLSYTEAMIEPLREFYNKLKKKPRGR